MNNQSRISTFWNSIDRERLGVPLIKFVENIQKIGISKTRAAEIFKIPRSKLMQRPSEGVMLVKIHALAAIRLEKLIKQAEEIVLNSLHPSAKDFDAGRWLGEWIEIQQPALAGLKPSDHLDTVAGGERVHQVLSAVESDVYL